MRQVWVVLISLTLSSVAVTQDGPTVTLGIEVSLPDRAVFYIPAVGNQEVLGIVPGPKGPFAGIRITPRMNTDSVHIEVSALKAARKKLSEATCEEVRSWSSEDADSYEGREGESLLLSGLGRLDRARSCPSH